MAMKKKPVTGMKDILPGEMVLRDYLIAIIKDTYRRFGFTPMETPCVEHIENLTSKQGGDNEKLIFRIRSAVKSCVWRTQRPRRISLTAVSATT